MSRTVITDVVMPIVSEILRKTGISGFSGPFLVRDEQLQLFLEEELRRLFGVIGADGCQHLQEQLEEAKKNDPLEFEHVLRELLKKFVKMQAMLRQAKKKEDELFGPPDRFSEQRRRMNILMEQQRRRTEEC